LVRWHAAPVKAKDGWLIHAWDCILKFVDRRRENRYSVSESVVVTVFKKPVTCYKPATLLDVSRSGFRIVVGLELVRETAVMITLNAIAIFGHVQYCRPSSDECFVVGVRILEIRPAVDQESSDTRIFATTLHDGSRNTNALPNRACAAAEAGACPAAATP